MKKMEHFRIEPANTALVVIDIQEKLFAVMPQNVRQNVEKNTRLLIAAAQEFDIPILCTEQYPKGLGQTIPEIKANLSGVAPIEKIAFSCCGEPAFCEALEKTGADCIILCGMETHICIYQTVIDLLEHGKCVFVAADAVCSQEKQHWKLALEAIRQAGGVVVPVQTILFQILRQAKTDQFKRLSKLL